MLLEILKRAKDRLSKKSNWCQYALATNPHGTVVPEINPDAVRWCLLGALDIARIDFGLNRDDICVPLLKIAPEIFPTTDKKFLTSLQTINDELGYDAVIEFLEKCIEKLENNNEHTASTDTPANESECQSPLDDGTKIEQI